MLCCKIRCDGKREIQEIPFCIQVRIGYPVIKRFDGLLITPEKLNSFCFTKTIITDSTLPVICQTCLYKVIILLIKYFSPKGLLVKYFLELRDIMCRFHKSQRIDRRQITALRVLVEYAISYRSL